eukprot:1143335-Rhodomonas_salina.1
MSQRSKGLARRLGLQVVHVSGTLNACLWRCFAQISPTRTWEEWRDIVCEAWLQNYHKDQCQGDSLAKGAGFRSFMEWYEAVKSGASFAGSVHIFIYSKLANVRLLVFDDDKYETPIHYCHHMVLNTGGWAYLWNTLTQKTRRGLHFDVLVPAHDASVEEVQYLQKFKSFFVPP